MALTRRSVLAAAGACCGAGLLGACSSSSSSSGSSGAGAASAAPGAGLVALADVPEGGAVSAELDGRTVLVVRRSGDEVAAFSAVCPHEGCTVEPDDDALSCPCHGSRFDLSGEVTEGPAQRGLTPVSVQVVDGQVVTA